MKKNEQYEKAVALLKANDCKPLSGCPGPNSHLEFWLVPSKGTLILQKHNSGGVMTYADWPLGSNWEEFEASISPAPEPRKIHPECPIHGQEKTS